MPVPGAKPKDGPVRHRVKPVHEWVEVADIPFVGEVPVQLPESYAPATVRWWSVVSSMPHCSIWTRSDWEFALESAAVRNLFELDPLKAGKELRDREKVMGTTLDYRRAIRVRYVPPEDVVPTEVASIADYRRAAAGYQPDGD